MFAFLPTQVVALAPVGIIIVESGLGLPVYKPDGFFDIFVRTCSSCGS